MSSGFHYLTYDEATELAADIERLLDRYRDNGPSATKGDDPVRRRLSYFFAQFPVEPPPDA